MNCYKQSDATKNAPALFVQIVAALLLVFFQTQTEGSENSMSAPTAFKKFHVSYDVRADASYTETDDMEITVLTEQGAKSSTTMPAGIPNPSMNMRKMEIEILSAYTRKKNGEHIDAIQPNPQPSVGASASGSAPPPLFPLVVFQNVEIGDTLVLSVKSIQNEPNVPNNLTITNWIPNYIANEDAVISLTAPASLDLHVETRNMQKEEKTTSGSTAQWVWKYQNLQPAKFQPILPPFESMTGIRISTYKDGYAEYQANRIAYLLRMPAKELCMTKTGGDNEGPVSDNEFATSINFYFWNRDDMLDRSVSAWNTATCTFDDGRPKLSGLKAGYKYVFRNQPDWSKSLARIEELKKKFPNKHFVALAEAQYWIDYAWNARGDGYASSVTNEGWKLFHERLEKAEKVLIDTKSYSAELPTWYGEMIEVQSALGRSEEDRDKTFLEGAKRYKTFYSIYFTMLNYLSPKWGGSWETVDNFVKWSVDNTKEVDGNSVYARLYWVASGDMREGESLFKDTRASWPKMKKGFEDLMARHPKSNWNLNNFARFACEAGDKKTFLLLRRQIGKNVMAPAWWEKPNLDLCEAKFAYAE